MMARYDEKTLAGRAKMLSGGDTGDRLAEVDEVLECLVVQTVEQHEVKLERDPLRYRCHFSQHALSNTAHFHDPFSFTTVFIDSHIYSTL